MRRIKGSHRIYTKAGISARISVALRVIADRLERGEAEPALLDLAFESA